MKKLIYIIIVFAFALTACEKTLDFPFEYKKPKLVLNGLLSTNQEIEFFVSRSMHILDSNDIVMIPDADVIIFEDGNPLQVVPVYINGGLYQAAYTPKVGHTYKFQISKDGFETIEAEAKMENPTTINSLTGKIKGTEDGSITYGGFFDVNLNFNDIPNEENYYIVYVTCDMPEEVKDYFDLNSYGDDGDYKLNIECNDLSVNSSYNGDVLYLADEIISGGNYTMKFTALDYRDIYGQFYEYEYYDDNEEEEEDPEEGEEPEPDIEDSPYYREFEYKLIVHVATISKDYYQYMKSFDLYNENDGNPFAEPTLVKTNVKNGLGILGASSEITDTVKLMIKNPYLEGER